MRGIDARTLERFATFFGFARRQKFKAAGLPDKYSGNDRRI